MRKIDWNRVEDVKEYARPVPGGYIGVITDVEDVEEKEYLLIEWDFATGELKGANLECEDRNGFWPMPVRRSYKPSALSFFKGFKTALEESNQGYRFNEDRLSDMRGKFIGIILGEEEYISSGGQVKTRLYVAQTRNVNAIRSGDFKVPDLKKLPENKVQDHNFSQLADKASDLPWDDAGLPW